MLEQERAPSVAEVQGAVARARRGKKEGQSPQIAESAQAPAAGDAAVVAQASGDLALEVLREATRAIESLRDLAPSLGSREGRKLLGRMRRALQQLEERIP